MKKFSKNSRLYFSFSTLLLTLGLNVSAYAADSSSQAKPAEPDRVGNIDPSQKDKFKTRYEAKDGRIFGFGSARGVNLNSDKILYSIVTGYEWEVGPTGALPLEAFAVFGDSNTFYGDVGLGYKHFFSDLETSAFLKGTIGAAGFKPKDSDSLHGFAFRVAAGVTFFRTSTKHLELMATYGAALVKSVQGYPHVVAFTVALIY
jgi:hypothetical protein